MPFGSRLSWSLVSGWHLKALPLLLWLSDIKTMDEIAM
jgi:hypothetical protein